MFAMTMLKNFLRTSDLSAHDLRFLLNLACDFKAAPDFCGRPLDGETIVLYFAEPSTRTRISFESAVAHLGGLPVVVGPNELQLGRGETIEDTARVISGYARAFVARMPSDDDLARFAAAATIPVINALTNRHHPCQSLADLMTLRERLGSLDGVRLAFVGDGKNNVTHSLIDAAPLTGLSLAIACPEGYEPDAGILAQARAAGGAITITRDPVEAVRGANAVYTDVWVSMGDPEEERAERMNAFGPYRVTPELMRHADMNAVFMHCLPAHREQEVSAEVIDGPQSVVFQQAENRLYTELAILYALTQFDVVVKHNTSVVIGIQ
jgi:ornithine carbamoyltransferase